MSVNRENLADRFAFPRHAARGDGTPAPAGRDALLALFLALLAALLGRLEPFALHPAPRAPAHPLPHSPYAVPYGTPGPRAARHRGPVPARACRRGRFPTWWARHRGARAIPRHAPELHPAQPARAPPRRAGLLPSVAKKRPGRGALSRVP